MLNAAFPKGCVFCCFANVIDDKYLFDSFLYIGIDNSLTISSQINELIIFYAHKLPSTSVDIYGQPRINATDLRNLLTYLKIKSNDNLCQVLSCDEAVYQYYKTPFI